VRRSPAITSILAWGCACWVLGGCTKSASSTSITRVAKQTSSAPTVASSVCDRQILKLDDMAGILSAPITGFKPLPGDAQSCEFTTASFPAIIVSLRPGLGRTTVDAWTTGKVPLTSSVLTGVGESAVWQEALHEVIAQQNAVLCDIQVRAGNGDLAMTSSALRAALGALCNRIFAAS
jgi:hypothetical protein